MNLTTVSDAADRLDVSPQRVYVLLAYGTLKGRTIGKTRMVEVASLETYAKSPTRAQYSTKQEPLDGLEIPPGPGLTSETRRMYDVEGAARAARSRRSDGVGR